MENNERRRFPRVKCAVSVDYLDPDSGGIIPYATASRNISQGGVCIILFVSISVGQMLDLTFVLPESFENVKARGRVAWVAQLRLGAENITEAYEAGIEFTDISDEDRKKITRYIAKQKP